MERLTHEEARRAVELLAKIRPELCDRIKGLNQLGPRKHMFQSATADEWENARDQAKAGSPSEDVCAAIAKALREKDR